MTANRCACTRGGRPGLPVVGDHPDQAQVSGGDDADDRTQQHRIHQQPGGEGVLRDTEVDRVVGQVYPPGERRDAGAPQRREDHGTVHRPDEHLGGEQGRAQGHVVDAGEPGAPLNGPLGLTLTRAGDLLTVNGGDNNLVELNGRGTVIGIRDLDPADPPGGALFGLAVTNHPRGVYYVNDDTNTLDVLR